MSLRTASQALINCLSEDSDDYTDASAYRMVMDKAKEVDAAKAALENPAVADAVLQDAGVDAVAQVEVDADEAEAKAQQDAADELEAAPKSELEAWEAMDAGDERTSFWSANKKAIMGQLESRNQKDG